jgi:hypothetical protein
MNDDKPYIYGNLGELTKLNMASCVRCGVVALVGADSFKDAVNTLVGKNWQQREESLWVCPECQ